MKDIDKKRMVFAFYLNNKTFDNKFNQLHFKLLKKYINIFDEVIFGLIVDEDIDVEVINRFQCLMLSFYHKNIVFKIVENTNYRESLVFKKEVVDKMSKLDGLTFFGHNKGISYADVTEDTLKWITALYYFNLGVELPYNGLNGKCFYGALKSKDIFLEDYTKGSDVVLPKYNWVYCGTFFWGKYQEIDNVLNNMGRSVPGMYSRWFDEMFPGNVLEEFWGSCYGECDVSRKLVLGNNIDEYIASTYEGNEWVCSDFYEFYENILKNEGIR